MSIVMDILDKQIEDTSEKIDHLKVKLNGLIKLKILMSKKLIEPVKKL